MSNHSKLKMVDNDAEETIPWYAEGLRFECTECGKCCTGEPGYVWVTKEEIQKIADFLGVPLKKIMRTHVRQKNNRYALIEKPSQNYDCIFLNGNKCQIYPVRPRQCRTFPWWVQNLKNRKSWEQTAKECEGIRPDAPLIPLKKIKEELHKS